MSPLRPTLFPVLASLAAASVLVACPAEPCEECPEQPIDCARAAAECGAAAAAATPAGLSMQAWRDTEGFSNPAPVPSGPPQYDDGTINVTAGSSNTDVGDVESDGTNGWEGFLIDDLPLYAGQLPVVYEEADETPMTTTAFDTQYDPDKANREPCGPTDQRCMADDHYGYVTLPAPVTFPDTNPTGSAARVTEVLSKAVSNCPGGTVTTTSVGWQYRVQVVDQGQAKWTEMWFVNALRSAPDQCVGNNQGDDSIIERHDNANTNPPVPRTFVAKLVQDHTTCGTGDPPWCGYCSAHTCKYVRLDLDWYKRK